MPVKSNPNGFYWAAMEDKEREVIEGALASNRGNITKTAAVLGIDRTYLTKLINKLGIENERTPANAVSTTADDDRNVLGSRLGEFALSAGLCAAVSDLSGGGSVVVYTWSTSEGPKTMEAAFRTKRQARADAADFLMGTGDWEE